MKNESGIKVVAGEEWVLSSPKHFWGVTNPTSQEYLKYVFKQAEVDGINDCESFYFKNWHIVVSKNDLFKKGLSFINKDKVNELFNSLVRFTDEDGNLGVRVEYPLKVFVNTLITLRENEILEIKGKGDSDIFSFFTINLNEFTAIAFKE